MQEKDTKPHINIAHQLRHPETKSGDIGGGFCLNLELQQRGGVWPPHTCFGAPCEEEEDKLPVAC